MIDVSCKNSPSKTTRGLQLRDFDFVLPDELIARKPTKRRDGARLLNVACSPMQEQMITDLANLVLPGDVWVINDTEVIPARLFGQKESGGKVEVLLLEPTGKHHQWLAWGKANKPLKVGQTIIFNENFSANILSTSGKEICVELIADDIALAIENHGHMPLPPYIDRPDTEEDQRRYQTIFARHKGAVAAPTAGLHLTESLMHKMEQAGASFVHITLHVGPGTFQPVQVENIENHSMHEEGYIISETAAATINTAKQQGRRIVAVGTTSLRTLEAATYNNQLQAGSNRTDIFIYPGYRFCMVDALLTNFHLPRSTLLMLVSALAGQTTIQQAYQHAIKQKYRFYSYGDAMFLTKTE